MKRESTRRYCDVCGSEIRSRAEKWFFGVKRNQKYCIVRTASRTPEEIESGLYHGLMSTWDDKIDLCEECYDHLKKWLKGRCEL